MSYATLLSAADAAKLSVDGPAQWLDGMPNIAETWLDKADDIIRSAALFGNYSTAIALEEPISDRFDALWTYIEARLYKLGYRTELSKVQGKARMLVNIYWDKT